MHSIKLHTRKIAIVNPLEGYYSFNLYHMQPAFYILLMGWCLCPLLYDRGVVQTHIKRKIF